MSRAWLWLVVGSGCWACGGTEPGSPAGPGGAGQGGVTLGGSSSDHESGRAGLPGQGGRGSIGVAGSGSAAVAGAADEPDEAGAGGGPAETGVGGDGMQGSAGSGEGEACNQLALLEVGPVCTPSATPGAAQGGTVVDGTYALVAYELLDCVGNLEQTLRIEQTAPNTYRCETVINAGDTRATASFVRQDAMFSSTSLCGASEVEEPYGYTAYEQQGVAYLRLINKGTFTYRRVGD